MAEIDDAGQVFAAFQVLLVQFYRRIFMANSVQQYG